MKLRWKWLVHWFPSKPGRKGWTLTCNGVWVGGVVRYRWGTPCIAYLTTPAGDRDLMRAATPGPAKHRVRSVAESFVRQGGTGVPTVLR